MFLLDLAIGLGKSVGTYCFAVCVSYETLMLQFDHNEKELTTGPSYQPEALFYFLLLLLFRHGMLQDKSIAALGLTGRVLLPLNEPRMHRHSSDKHWWGAMPEEEATTLLFA